MENTFANLIANSLIKFTPKIKIVVCVCAILAI